MDLSSEGGVINNVYHYYIPDDTTTVKSIDKLYPLIFDHNDDTGLLFSCSSNSDMELSLGCPCFSTRNDE